MGWLGRARNGTGLAGSETYSSKAAPPAGGVKPSFRPGSRYSDFVVAAGGGHVAYRRHWFVPVSNAVTGAMSALGAPSFRYWSRKGSRTSRWKVRDVLLSKRRAPSELPSWTSWPWNHGPITRNTRSLPASFGSSAR